MIPFLFLFSLYLNDSQDLTLKSGEPLVISIIISSSEYQQGDIAQTLRQQIEKRYQDQKITEEEYRRELDNLSNKQGATYVIADQQAWAQKIRIERYNQERSAWEASGLPLHFLGCMPDTTTAVISGSAYYVSYWGVDPEDITSLGPDRSRLRAAVMARMTPGNQETEVTSAEALITLDKSSPPPSPDKLLPVLADYFARRKDLSRAREYGGQYLRLNEENPMAYSLMGKIAEEGKDYDEAVKNYLTARKMMEGYPEDHLLYLNQKIMLLMKISPSSFEKMTRPQK